MKSPRLIKNRHGNFYFRLIVPLSMREAVGKTELRRSLNTKNPKVATLRALYLNLLVEQGKAQGEAMPNFSDFDFSNIDKYKLDVKNGIFEADGEADHRNMLDAVNAIGKLSLFTTASPQSSAPVQPARIPSPLFSDAMEPYLSERELDNKASTVYEKRLTYNEFIEWMGDHELDAYKKSEIMAYKSKLMEKGNGAIRINNKIGFISHFLKWAAAHDHYHHPSNPCDGLRIGKTSKLRENCQHREQFTHDELNMIFKPTTYQRFMDRPDYFWVPLIGLFTGARIEELSKLEITDFKSDYGVQFFKIKEGKTANSTRQVSICDRLIDLGLLRYVEDVRNLNLDNKLLFPYLVKSQETLSANDKIIKYSKDVSRCFGELLDLPEVNLSSRAFVFHSFRHTLITKLSSVGCNQSQVMHIVGHEDSRKTAHYDYIHHGLPGLKQALDKVDFGLDLNALRYEQGQFVPQLQKLVEKRKRRIAQEERKTERAASKKE